VGPQTRRLTRGCQRVGDVGVSAVSPCPYQRVNGCRLLISLFVRGVVVFTTLSGLGEKGGKNDAPAELNGILVSGHIKFDAKANGRMRDAEGEAEDTDCRCWKRKHSSTYDIRQNTTGLARDSPLLWTDGTDRVSATTRAFVVISSWQHEH
jgi:hypothetical protein